jgi:hypothetical protein
MTPNSVSKYASSVTDKILSFTHGKMRQPHSKAVMIPTGRWSGERLSTRVVKTTVVSPSLHTQVSFGDWNAQAPTASAEEICGRGGTAP